MGLRTFEGHGRRIWQNVDENGVGQSLLLDSLGRWELAQVDAVEVIGNPVGMSEIDALALLDKWEPGVGTGVARQNARRTVDRLELEMLELGAELAKARQRLGNLPRV